MVCPAEPDGTGRDMRHLSVSSKEQAAHLARASWRAPTRAEPGTSDSQRARFRSHEAHSPRQRSHVRHARPESVRLVEVPARRDPIPETLRACPKPGSTVGSRVDRMVTYQFHKSSLLDRVIKSKTAVVRAPSTTHWLAAPRRNGELELGFTVTDTRRVNEVVRWKAAFSPVSTTDR